MLAGLLEGAHAGRGLGHEFLRHCQRARILVHVIDGSSPDPVGDYAAIQTELQLFAEDLASKPQACVALLQLRNISCLSVLCVTASLLHAGPLQLVDCLATVCVSTRHRFVLMLALVTVVFGCCFIMNWQPFLAWQRAPPAGCHWAVDATLVTSTVCNCRLWHTTRWMCQTHQITGKTSSTAWKQLACHQSVCAP